MIMLLIPHVSWCQSLTGKVVDSKSNAIEFANVALYDKDSTFLVGTVTDSCGVFVVNCSKNKASYLKVSCVGYCTQIVTVSNEKKYNVTLQQDNVMLKDIIVKGHLPKYNRVPGGYSVAINNSILEKLFSANDILSSLPRVTGSNGNFFVFGKGTPEIYINNRKLRDKYELAHLKPSDIDKITILTNPGVKYDSEVKSVIIIKTKKTQGEGLSGSVDGVYGQKNKASYDSNINLNWRSSKFDLFGSLGHSNNYDCRKQEVEQTIHGYNHEINENTAQTSCELAEQAKGRCIYYNASEEGLMYMAKQIKDSLTMKPVGILRASIKLSYLKKMTITARDSLAAHIFLLDNDKNVLIESAENDATISDRSWIEKISGNTGEFLFTADGQGYDCVYQRSSDTGLTVVGMIPMSFLQKTARGLQKTTIMLILASLMLCIFLANILAKGIAGPIKRTSKAMQQFAEGDFSVRLPEGRRDEIGAMNSVFNQTIEKIEQLIKQVVEMETVNKDIEFQALQAQINPHFLYNVLDTINWMARKKGEDNICRMVTSISSLMRASISNKRSIVYIREEIKYVQDYLYIQETRYGDKFTSYIEVDERLNELEIPKMTIQTLVENAVVHGVENATWDCFLYVSGEITDGMAVFTVKDDGVGMSQEQLEKLMGTEEEPDHEAERTHTHLGVYAVRKRLDYVYQNKARMSITSEPGKGTQVILEIPMNGNVGVTYRKCDEPVNENNKKRGDER